MGGSKFSLDLEWKKYIFSFNVRMVLPEEILFDFPPLLAYVTINVYQRIELFLVLVCVSRMRL